MTSTPAQRAKALLEKFGPVTEVHHNDDGYWTGEATVSDLTVQASAIDSETQHLAVYVYDWSSNTPTLLSLSQVRDDDLVESIVRQVIDHHHGWQVL